MRGFCFSCLIRLPWFITYTHKGELVVGPVALERMFMDKLAGDAPLTSLSDVAVIGTFAWLLSAEQAATLKAKTQALLGTTTSGAAASAAAPPKKEMKEKMKKEIEDDDLSATLALFG